jgi:hypothetical protein
MIRRISTKWVLAVLVAVVVPFLGFAWYVDVQLADRISHDIVRYYLLRQAAELADRIDGELLERRRDVELLASDPVVVFSASGARPDGALPLLEPGLDRLIATSAGFDLLLVVDAGGALVGASRALRGGGLRPAAEHEDLVRRDHAREAWFQAALAGETHLVDQHASPLLHARALDAGELDLTRPENLAVGIAAPVRAADGRVVGVVYGLLSWTAIQIDLLDRSRRARAFEGIGAEIYASSYSWLWRADAATIIGHPRRDLYGAGWTRRQSACRSSSRPRAPRTGACTPSTSSSASASRRPTGTASARRRAGSAGWWAWGSTTSTSTRRSTS